MNMRVLALESLHHIIIVAEWQASVVPGDDVELSNVGASGCCGFEDFIGAHQVGTFLAFVATEAAEATMGLANIGIVNMSILVEIDPSPVLRTVHTVG